MKDILYALLVVLPFAAISFFGLPAMGVERSAAHQLGVALLTGGTTYVRREIEKSRQRRRRDLPAPEEYGLSPVVVLLVTTFACLAVYNIIGFFAGFGAGAVAAPRDSEPALPIEPLMNATLPLQFAIFIVALFFIGRRVGQRSRHAPALLGGLSIVLFVVLDWVLGTLVVPTEKLPLWGQGPMAMIPKILLFLPAALIGVWRGRKTRLQSCVAYALDIVPPDTKNALVAEVFESAHRYTRAAPVGGGASEAVSEGPSSPMVGAH